MKIEKLDLVHQSLLEEKFHLMQLNLSEYSFANLYLFRHVHDYEVMFDRDEVFIKGNTRDGKAFIMLTSSPELLKDFDFGPVLLYPIPQEWIHYFERKIEQSSICEADSDYVFSVDKFAHYPGRDLSKKRNQVKQFLDHHTVESREYRPEDKEDALFVLKHWQGDRDRDTTDYFQFQESVELFDRLRLHGRIFHVDGKPEGLMIGEWLNKSYYVLHFNKACKDVLGLYQYMYQDLAQSLEGKCEYINLEQDLGLPALRQAKHSYHPDFLIHKWRLLL